jgi:hypothetical protein
MFEHAYAEMPLHLREQKAQLTKELTELAEEGKNG